MQRVYQSLSGHEGTSGKPDSSPAWHVGSSGKLENKDPKEGWTTWYDFDFAAWHAIQAGLWEMMGEATSRSLLALM